MIKKKKFFWSKDTFNPSQFIFSLLLVQNHNFWLFLEIIDNWQAPSRFKLTGRLPTKFYDESRVKTNVIYSCPPSKRYGFASHTIVLLTNKPNGLGNDDDDDDDISQIQ